MDILVDICNQIRYTWFGALRWIFEKLRGRCVTTDILVAICNKTYRRLTHPTVYNRFGELRWIWVFLQK